MSHDSEEWYKVWRKTDSWLSESVKIENSWRKSFLKIEWSSKTLWKMISADVKRKTTRNKRSGGSILQIFIRRTSKTLNAI